MIEPIGYKLNPKKLKKAPQYITPYLFLGAFYYTEDYEYFDVIEPYLDIPEKPKTLEEISQEFDEKIDKLIEDTKAKFYGSKIYADSKYEEKFDKIFDNFEYAKKTGAFPQYLSVATLGNSGAEWTTSWFSLNASKNSVGYYYIEPSLKLYMNKTPNMIVRFCMDKLLNFRWVDT